MLSSSGLAAATVTVRGSSAIPHFGQLPGSGRTTSGCIGQVYSVFVASAAGASGSSAMPHFGHAPGPSLLTSGSIGHTYFTCASAELIGAAGFAGAAPSCTSCGAGFGARYFFGSPSNFVAHPLQQKKYSLPPCSTRAAAFAGSTFIPHTGSMARLAATALSPTDSIRNTSPSSIARMS
jgi:hypothetical protein